MLCELVAADEDDAPLEEVIGAAKVDLRALSSWADKAGLSVTILSLTGRHCWGMNVKWAGPPVKSVDTSITYPPRAG